MITNKANEFESNIFAMQIIARGGFVDNGVGAGKKYYVDTINLRANHVMQNNYLDSTSLNNRVCYETHEEWIAHQREYDMKRDMRDIWEEKVKSDLQTVIPNIYDGSCLIKWVTAEFFTVMHVYEITD